MSRQYKRAYELTITSEDGSSKIIKHLRINFEITKTILGFPNLCRLSIYNANNDTLSLLQKEYTKITLNAGYEGNIRLLFKGEVRNIFQNKKGVDKIIDVYAGDGEKDWQNSTFNKTFKETVSMQTIIKDVISSFKELTTGVLEGLPNEADKILGQSISGSSKDVMDMFAKEYGFNWSVQDGEIVTTPIDEPLSGNQAVLINSVTGMIGSPTITIVGADVTTLLNPKLLPNKAFKIESINANVQLGNLFFRDVKRTTAEGTYKIQEVIFKGDSREGDWLSSVKGKILNV